MIPDGLRPRVLLLARRPGGRLRGSRWPAGLAAARPARRAVGDGRAPVLAHRHRCTRRAGRSWTGTTRCSRPRPPRSPCSRSRANVGGSPGASRRGSRRSSKSPLSEIEPLLTGGRSFVWVQRRLPPAVADQVRALGEPGLGLAPDSLRLYPNRELAAHVLGFEGTDGGLEGIERAWDRTLAGTPGKAIVGRDALGRDVVTQHVLQKPAPGHGVMLTLDANIQYIAEREIDAA